MKHPWHLLIHLINRNHFKAEQNQRLTHTIKNYQGSDATLLNAILPKGTHDTLPTNAGPDNHELDKEISEAEVQGAIFKIRPNSEPGRENITNSMLRNLTDDSIRAITKFFNHHWTQGTLPKSWKHAKLTFSPKPENHSRLNISDRSPSPPASDSSWSRLYTTDSSSIDSTDNSFLTQ